MKHLLYTILHPFEMDLHKRRMRHHKEAIDKIQVKEYNGGFYISFEGIPLFDVDYVSTEFTEVADMIKEIRARYEQYLNSLLP